MLSHLLIRKNFNIYDRVKFLVIIKITRTAQIKKIFLSLNYNLTLLNNDSNFIKTFNRENITNLSFIY